MGMVDRTAGNGKWKGKWNFIPYQERIPTSVLKEIPRTKEGDQELLEALLSMTTLSDYHIHLILTEAAHRPAIYERLHQLVLQHRPESQLHMNWARP
jgi:hypothetical protein